MGVPGSRPVEVGQVRTPLGPFYVVWAGAVIRSGFGPAPEGREGPGVRRVLRAVKDFFAGGAFPRVEVRFAGTPFENAVWEALSQTAPGDRLSYAELASRIDRPRAVRAVGRTVGKNPIPLFVPCHRVVPKDGRLGNYGLGPWRKAALILLEAGKTDLEDRIPGLRAHPDLAAVRLDDLLGDGQA